MKDYRLASGICIILILLGFQSFAQGSFTATVSKNPVRVGEYFQYTATLANLNGSITPPRFEGFQVIQGPSTSTRMNIINGKRSSEYSETWVLLPEKEGSFSIDPAVAVVGGQTMRSNVINLKVVKADARDNNTKLPSNQNVMVVVELSQQSAYVGEQIIATYKLYSRYADVRFENLEYPSMGGFWTESVEEDMIEWEPQMANVNGVSYRVAVLKKDILYPQVSGEITIDPVKIEMLARGRSFFERYQKMVAQSRPVTVNVKALPPAPEGELLGTYDQLSMEVSIDRESLPANEAATLKIRFSGKGNLKLLNDPGIRFPSDLEVFEPKRDDRITVNAAGMSGSRSFEYVLIPRVQGNYEIPAAELIYFDAGSGKYKTLNTPSFTLNVSKGSGENNAYTYNSKTDVSILNTDIRFIQTEPGSVQPVNRRFFGSIPYYGLSLAPVLAFLILLWYKRREAARQSNPKEWQTKQAGRVAKKHLQSAASLAGKGNPQLMFGELLKAVQGYLGDKFHIPTSEMDERKLRARLSRELNPQLLEQVVALIKDCEMARFAGLDTSDEQAALQRAEALIRELEKQVK